MCVCVCDAHIEKKIRSDNPINTLNPELIPLANNNLATRIVVSSTAEVMSDLFFLGFSDPF